MDLESLLVKPEGFGLTDATPVQRAACRIISGKPLADLAAHPDVLKALGGTVPPPGQPREFMLLAAIRSGKSLISACAAVWASQTCDVSRIGPGEVPRVSVISVHKDQAQVVLDHIVGRVMASKVMRKWVVGEPTSDGISMRHPSGRIIEMKVVAGSRAGSTLVARWSAGCIFDEAPRMVGVEDGVVNLEDARSAVLGRVLPGSLILYIGSPWAPFGPVYNWTSEFFGDPANDRGLVVMRAPGPLMNPTHWTPERCERLRIQDPKTYRTDALGEFADPEEALFGAEMIRGASRKTPGDIKPEEGHHYVAAMDPATRSNAWTFVIMGCEWGGPAKLTPMYRVVVARQWKPRTGERVSPRSVLEEIATLCSEYDCGDVHTDQFSADALSDLADTVGVSLAVHTIGQKEKYENIAELHTILSEGRLELANEADMARDLGMVRKKVTQMGVSFVLPKTADGRHCDYVPALGLAVRNPPEPPELPAPVLEPLEARRKKLQEQAEEPYWEGIERRFMGRAVA